MKAARTIGRYRIDASLGTGAMGKVYRAYDPLIDRPVAIKVVRPELISGEGAEQWLQRFRREARAAGRRFHPNIIAVLDCGDDNGVPFLAMEYVEGQNLDAVIKASGPLDPARGIPIITQVLNALGFIHKNGIIHRGVKPSNIMVLENDQIKVADFGIARINASELTIVGDVLGTPAYMAPEQLAGAPVDERTDLFAAGVILFEMLTGVKPFRGRSITEILCLTEKRGPEDITLLNPAVPEALKQVIGKALAFDPAARYPSADAFATAVTEVFVVPSEQGPPTEVLRAEAPPLSVAPPPEIRANALRPKAIANLPISSVPPAMPISHPAVAPRLSIVVLPFTNLSDDREQQYFADGITEDLTTDLSRIADMLVISRNTAFTYRDKPIDTKQIGRELGVRYVLEGSVRRSGSRVRVNAQLIDALIDAHLWADRCDCTMADLLGLQDEITRWIANALGIELIAAEAARPTEHPDALDYILRGRAALLRQPSRDGYVEAISLFECALALDPRSVDAQSWLASALVDRVLFGIHDSAAADIARAEGLIEQALAASPDLQQAHFAKAQLLRAQGRPEEAIPEYETVIASNRNWVFAIFGLARCKLLTGSIEEAIPLYEQAIRLSPRDPYIAHWYSEGGSAHLLQSRTDEAILWFEKAHRANPRLAFVHIRLAAAYGLKGLMERAASELAEARRLAGDDRYSSIVCLRSRGYRGVLKIRALEETTYFAGLHKAGMPEE